MDSYEKSKSNTNNYTKHFNSSNRSLKNLKNDNNNCLKSIQQYSPRITSTKRKKQNISNNLSRTIPHKYNIINYRNNRNDYIKSNYESKSYNNINLRKKKMIKINLKYKGKIKKLNKNKSQKELKFINNPLLLYSERVTIKNNSLSNCNSESLKNISINIKSDTSNKNIISNESRFSLNQNCSSPKTTRKNVYNNKIDLENNDSYFKKIENKIKEIQDRIKITKNSLYINNENFPVNTNNHNISKNDKKETPSSTKIENININSKPITIIDKDKKKKNSIKKKVTKSPNDIKNNFNKKNLNNKISSFYTILNINTKYHYNNNHNFRYLPKKRTLALPLFITNNKNNIFTMNKYIRSKKYNSKNRSKNQTPINVLKNVSTKKNINIHNNYIYNNYMVMTPNRRNKINNINNNEDKKILFSNKTSKSISNSCNQLYTISSSIMGERNNKKILCLRNKKRNLSSSINVMSSNKEIIKKKNDIIEKRIIKNASICRKGKNRENEPEKINQDNLFKIKFEDLNLFFYGVCDGHGLYGHLVSNFIKNNLPIILYDKLKTKINISDNNNNIVLYKAINDSFLQTNYQLYNNSNIDINVSGSTCISILLSNSQIITANVGDSRAIKGQYLSENKKWVYEVLSKDHKLEDKDEYLRIKKNNGIIHPYINEDKEYIGPQRVWIKDKNIPGLGMSRSFGDKVFSSVGVIATPEIFFFKNNVMDKFIVIGSDGLWMYVSNQETIEIVGKYYESLNCDQAIEELYNLAKSRFEENDDYIDDITIIILFLE